MYHFIKEYEKEKLHSFNDDIILNMRKQDHMTSYIVDICKAIEVVPYYKFLGWEEITDENKIFDEFNRGKNKKTSIKDSRLSLIRLKFRIDYKDESDTVTMSIFIPKLINNYFYIINGIAYYAIYQNVDSLTYNTRNSVILKSLLMPIHIKSEGKSYKDIFDEEYSTNIFILNLFSKKINILYYYLAEFGYKKTLEFLGLKNKLGIVNTPKKNNISDNDKFLYFPINKEKSVKINKELFNTNKYFKSMAFCFIDVFYKKNYEENRNDIDFWKIKLGSQYTKNTNTQIEKANTVLLSFKRILDNRTKKNLKIPEKDKQDIFYLIRWMAINFIKLMKRDNLSLLNKRIRFSEYQVNSFNKKMSTKTYRLLNSKSYDMKRLKAIFNIPPRIIIDDLAKSDLLRYNNSVNDMDVFNCGLKFSNRGPSSIGENSKKNIPISYRGIYISHIGRLSLNSISTGDPGMSGCLSPFIRTDGFYYNTTELDKREKEKKNG